MSITRFFTGFEGGEDIYPFLSSNRVVFLDDGKAPTGQWSLYCNGPGNDTGSGYASFPSFAPVGLVDGNFANANMRCRFVIERTIPTNDDVTICGFGENADNITGVLLVKSTGEFAARAGEEIGTYSTAQLEVGTEYIAEVLVNVIDNGGNADITTTCRVYDSSGVLIEEVSCFDGTGNFTTPYQILSCSVGHLDLNACDYFVRFDDVISVVEDDGPATLPTATRVTRVDVTAINHQGAWTGDYRDVLASPFPFDETQEISSSAESTLSFNHAPHDDLGITGVEALQLYVHVKSSNMETNKFVINTNYYDLATDTTYGAVPQTYQFWQTITDADFDSLIFGVKNSNASDVNIAQCFVEALHSGTNYWPSQFAGVDSWKHKVITWTGTGDYQYITGVGFKSQLILAKKSAGTNSPSLMKFGFMGGTGAKETVGEGYWTRGIMQITDDGFLLGPSQHVNQNGIEYTAICIQDGGYNFGDMEGNDCRYARFGAYVGDTSAAREITVKEDWEPEFVFISGDVTCWSYPNGFYAPANPTVLMDDTTGGANLINGTFADGFEVDTLLDVRDMVYYYFAFRPDEAGDLYEFFNYDYLPLPVTTFGDQPCPIDFIAVKQMAVAVDAQWRQQDIQIGLNSNLWGDCSTNTTGITDIVLSGPYAFTLGTTLNQPGSRAGFLIFADEGALEEAQGDPTSDAGPDQEVDAFNIVNLAGSGTGGGYPCADLSYLWTVISGPGGQLFSDPTDPTTTVAFTISGVYVFRLTVSNGISSASDDVQITIVNAAPVVVLDGDQTILAGDEATVTATTRTDDGLPIPPGEIVNDWSILGPAAPILVSLTDTTATWLFEEPGVYTISLAVFDGEKTTTASVTITVLAACVLPSEDPETGE